MKPNVYPPTIALTDLVAACGVDGVHDLALACGATEIEPKPNQVWRCALESQVIIGYKTSAVVAGRDALTMAHVAAWLRHVAIGEPDEPITRYRLYARALDVRNLTRRLTHADTSTMGILYPDLVADLAEMDEVQFEQLTSIMREYAPDELRTAMLFLAVYERGVQDGLDASTPDFDEDDIYLPDIAPTPPTPPMVQSA